MENGKQVLNESKALNDRITYLHIKRAIKIIIPKEYVSSECSP